MRATQAGSTTTQNKPGGKKALIKPRLHTLIVIMNLTSSGLNELSKHSECYKGHQFEQLKAAPGCRSL